MPGIRTIVQRRRGTGRIEVAVEQGTLLAGITGVAQGTVSSAHHQAVGRVGEGFVLQPVPPTALSKRWNGRRRPDGRFCSSSSGTRNG